MTSSNYDTNDMHVSGELEAVRPHPSIYPHNQPLPPGEYEYKPDGFVRIGDPYTMHRYHGMALKAGTTLSEFKVFYHGPLYTTIDPMVATEYAVPSGWTTSQPIPGEGVEGREAQLYVLELNPDVIINAGNCKSDDDIYDASVGSNIDVVECPEYWEQPETIIHNPDIVSVGNGYRVEKGTDDEGRSKITELIKLTDRPDTEFDRLIMDSVASDPKVNRRWGGTHLTAEDIASPEAWEKKHGGKDQMPDLEQAIKKYNVAEQFRKRQKDLLKITNRERKNINRHSQPKPHGRGKIDYGDSY